jgi:hypothetical protein
MRATSDREIHYASPQVDPNPDRHRHSRYNLGPGPDRRDPANRSGRQHRHQPLPRQPTRVRQYRSASRSLSDQKAVTACLPTCGGASPCAADFRTSCQPRRSRIVRAPSKGDELGQRGEGTSRGDLGWRHSRNFRTTRQTVQRRHAGGDREGGAESSQVGARLPPDARYPAAKRRDPAAGRGLPGVFTAH